MSGLLYIVLIKILNVFEKFVILEDLLNIVITISVKAIKMSAIQSIKA